MLLPIVCKITYSLGAEQFVATGTGYNRKESEDNAMKELMDFLDKKGLSYLDESVESILFT